MKRLEFTGLLALLLLVTNAFAERDVNRPAGPRPGGSGNRTSNYGCAIATARAELDVNGIRTLILNGGDMWWDLVGNPRYEFPKTTDPSAVRRNVLFAGGIWVGGRDPEDTSTIFVQAQTYRQNGQVSYWPGPIDTITTFTTRARCAEWDQIFTCTRAAVSQYVLDFQAGRITNENDIPESIRYWPGRNNPFLRRKPGKPVQNINFSAARFNDVNGDGRYNPLQGDYPRLPGDRGRGFDDLASSSDQCLFFITNDVGGIKDYGTATGSTSDAIGMEIHTEAFAYTAEDQQNEMTFYRNKLINKGQRILNNTYFGMWVDPDIGFAYDDFVGCDVPRGLGFAYNGVEVDPGNTGYGANPPTVGVDYFIGPEADRNDGIDNDKDMYRLGNTWMNIDETSDNGIDDDNDGITDEPDETERIIVSNYLYYNNDGSPQNGNPGAASDYYNYLRNRWRDGRRVSYDNAAGLAQVGNGVPAATFMFPGSSDQAFCWGSGGSPRNPCLGGTVRLNPWTEQTARNQPGDRRFLLSGGPFTLRPGMTNELTIGVVVARATSGGPLGSLTRLLTADDASQRLYDRDFEIKRGPRSPLVRGTELDREVLLEIAPDTIGGRFLEDFTYVDPALRRENGDIAYRFEGYIVYQLRDNTVSSSELNNPDRARVIAVLDKRNDISGRVVNQLFDPELEDSVKQLMVTLPNNGLGSRVLRINRDAFNPSIQGLINHKKYYFRVTSFAININRLNPEPYLVGDPYRDVVTGNTVDKFEFVPHKVESEFGGTVINSSFGNRFEIERIAGVGSGGARLQLKPSVEQEIFANNGRPNRVVYETSGSPLTVSVYNPKLVRDGTLLIKLFSRIEFNPQRATYRPQIGDTILSEFDRNGNVPTLAQFSQSVGQSKGLAVVRAVYPVNDTLSSLKVDVLNDADWGSFTKLVDQNQRDNSVGAGPDDVIFATYLDFAQRFFKVENGQANTSTSATCIRFRRHDFFEVSNPADPSFYSGNIGSLDATGEVLVPQYGIGISIQNVEPVYAKNQTKPNLGFLEAQVSYSSGLQPWLTFLQSDPAKNGRVDPFDSPIKRPWLVDFRTSPPVGGNSARRFFENYFEVVDKNEVTVKMLDGAVAPYAAGLQCRPPQAFPGPRSTGPVWASGAFSQDSIQANLRSLGNYDLVFTNDRSKWTRCVVFQQTVPAGVSNVFASAYTLMKSTVPSLDINGNPDGSLAPNGQPSRGMSWFPGYAIDVDRGRRVMLAFSEARLDTGNRALPGGDDAIWQYSTIDQFGQVTANLHFVYVLALEYNEANLRSTENFYDEVGVFPPRPNIGVRNSSIAGFMVKNFMWTAYPLRISTVPINNGEVRMQLRVNRGFQSDLRNSDGTTNPPTFRFNISGQGASRGVTSVAKSALNLIRVVPNPYYAYSAYEQSQIDSRVKITNLPPKCKISIFNLNGTLVRAFNIDFTNTTTNNQTTWQEWDLKNADGIPVASGMYLIHVDAGNLGTQTIKFFGAMRPIDLDGVVN